MQIKALIKLTKLKIALIHFLSLLKYAKIKKKGYILLKENIFWSDLHMPPPDALWDFGQGELVVVGENATAGIFATYPSKHLTLVNGFFDQVRLI